MMMNGGTPTASAAVRGSNDLGAGGEAAGSGNSILTTLVSFHSRLNEIVSEIPVTALPHRLASIPAALRSSDPLWPNAPIIAPPSPASSSSLAPRERHHSFSSSLQLSAAGGGAVNNGANTIAEEDEQQEQDMFTVHQSHTEED